MTEQQIVKELDLESPGAPGAAGGVHGTIIPFEPYRERREKYEELREEYVASLEETSRDLYDKAINLAMNGAWASWDEEQPIGTRLEFTPEMLFDCPDTRVRRIMALWETIMNVLWDEEVGANP